MDEPIDAPAVFERHGTTIVPSPLAQGPWEPGAQHGGAAAGLLAWVVEQVPSPVPMRVARLTVDLMRRVPLTPLTWHTDIVREGKLIQLVDAAIVADDQVVARASALRIRVGAGLDLSEVADDLPDRAPPAGPTGVDPGIPPMPGFVRAVQFDGQPIGVAGPKDPIRWVRLRVPLVAGEATSPFVTLAALSDFTSGFGNVLPFDRYTSINPDLGLQILREPRSDWIGVAASTDLDPDGLGVSVARLHDLDGLVAHSTTSLLVRLRD